MSSLGPNEAEFARSLARIAANDPTFTRVEFDWWEIGDEGAGRLVEALRGNTTVRFIDLLHSGTSGALVSALARVLESSTSLRVLNLGENRFGVEGARALAGFLRNNSSLRRLLLWNCGIGVAGVRVLTEALPSNSSLNDLGLAGNNISDAGASAVAEFLRGNSTLDWIDLGDNGISDAGVTALAEALPRNTSLSNIWMEGNDVSDVGARLLATALLVNSSVTELDLMRNDISEALQRLVDDLIQINRDAPNPQEAVEIKVEWLRNLDEDDLSLLGLKESEVEEEVRRLETVCRVGWLIDSGVDGEKEEAVTMVLDQLDHFPQADQRRRLFKRLLGVPGCGVEVATSVDETTARTLYRYAVQCGAAPGVLVNLLRAHGSLCTCRDIEHHLIPFMLLATMPEAGVGEVMELLLINPSLVESGISVSNEH